MRYFAILFFTFWLVGCTTHRGTGHQTHKEYVFPENANKSCFNICKTNKNQCETESQETYENCLKDAQDQAQSTYDEKRAQYKKEYNRNGEKIVKKSGGFDFTVSAESDSDEASQELAPKYNDSLQSEQEKCLVEHLKYDCQQENDACFRKCGGKIIYK